MKSVLKNGSRKVSADFVCSSNPSLITFGVFVPTARSGIGINAGRLHRTIRRRIAKRWLGAMIAVIYGTWKIRQRNFFNNDRPGQDLFPK
jgi:hypothetical protein